MTDNEGWVRVHPEPVDPSDAECLTRNSLREMVETIFEVISPNVDADANRSWWEQHPQIDALINPTASDIAAEYEVKWTSE